MRRSTTLLALVFALVAAACTDDPTTAVTGAETTPTSAAPTTEAPETPSPTTTVADPTPSSTTAPTTTTTTEEAPTTTIDEATTDEATTDEERGMCADWIPLVTDSGTTCVDPATLPPEGVAAGTPWELPTVSAADLDAWWWRPPLALLHRDTVTLLESTEGGGLTATPWMSFTPRAEEIRVGSDGSIVLQHVDPAGDVVDFTDVVVHRPDGTTEAVPGGDWLYDLAPFGETEVIVVAANPTDTSSEAEGQLRLRDVADPASDLGPLATAVAAEYGVGWVDVVDGLAVITAWADLTELVHYRDLASGAEVVRPSPTDELGYNQPPLVIAATLSADGARVTWAEGPDWDGATGDVVPAEWRIITMRLDDGVRVLEWPVSETLTDPYSYQVHSVHDLGTHILVNFVEWQMEQWWPRPATVIDLTTEEPEAWSLPYAGIVVPVPYTVG